MGKFFKLMIDSWATTIPILLALLISMFIVIFASLMPSKMPLFYSLPWGDSQLGSSEQLLILPAIIVLITLFNLILSWQLHPSQIFFKKILNFSSILVSIILTITFIKIVIIFL